MTETITTYCVCGRASRDEPWETIEAGLTDFAAAEAWMRQYVAEGGYREYFGETPHLYIDREENENDAEAYYEVIDGELSDPFTG